MKYLKLTLYASEGGYCKKVNKYLSLINFNSGVAYWDEKGRRVLLFVHNDFSEN